MSERYQIQEQIGRGGLGVVYRALDTQLGRDVAIKRVLVNDGEPVDRLMADLVEEAKTLSALNHPNIVTVHDVGQDADGPYVVMELLQGETLDHIIERAPLPVEQFEEFAVQALEGLIAAQSVDLLHRDLKPANLMLVWLPSGKFQVKILDFGLAMFSRKPSVQAVDQDDSVLGSIYFMAPEQFEQNPIDSRTDLYSLGAIFYYTLAGRYPFEGESPIQVISAHLNHRVVPLRELRPDVPDSICAWIETLIAPGIDDRPANAQAALDAWNPVPILDEKQIREVASNDPKVAAELLAKFEQEANTLLQELDAQLASGQSAAARETAQTIRGTASTLGYTEIISIASQIEENAEANGEQCRILAGGFEGALKRLEKAVSRIQWADQPSQRQREANILVADDGLVMRTALSLKLKEQGYTVTAVASGEEALEAIDSGPFDLVVLDIYMPGLDGIETLHRIRQNRSSVQLPVIMATARDEDEDVVGCFEAGASDFVSKPINFPVLFARIDTHLTLKRAMEDLERLGGSPEMDPGVRDSPASNA